VRARTQRLRVVVACLVVVDIVVEGYHDGPQSRDLGSLGSQTLESTAPSSVRKRVIAQLSGLLRSRQRMRTLERMETQDRRGQMDQRKAQQAQETAREIQSLEKAAAAARALAKVRARQARLAAALLHSKREVKSQHAAHRMSSQSVAQDWGTVFDIKHGKSHTANLLLGEGEKRKKNKASKNAKKAAKQNPKALKKKKKDPVAEGKAALQKAKKTMISAKSKAKSIISSSKQKIKAAKKAIKTARLQHAKKLKVDAAKVIQKAKMLKKAEEGFTKQQLKAKGKVKRLNVKVSTFKSMARNNMIESKKAAAGAKRMKASIYKAKRKLKKTKRKLQKLHAKSKGKSKTAKQRFVKIEQKLTKMKKKLELGKMRKKFLQDQSATLQKSAEKAKGKIKVVAKSIKHSQSSVSKMAAQADQLKNKESALRQKGKNKMSRARQSIQLLNHRNGKKGGIRKKIDKVNKKAKTKELKKLKKIEVQGAKQAARMNGKILKDKIRLAKFDVTTSHERLSKHQQRLNALQTTLQNKHQILKRKKKPKVGKKGKKSANRTKPTSTQKPKRKQLKVGKKAKKSGIKLATTQASSAQNSHLKNRAPDVSTSASLVASEVKIARAAAKEAKSRIKNLARYSTSHLEDQITLQKLKIDAKVKYKAAAHKARSLERKGVALAKDAHSKNDI